MDRYGHRVIGPPDQLSDKDGVALFDDGDAGRADVLLKNDLDFVKVIESNRRKVLRVFIAARMDSAREVKMYRHVTASQMKIIFALFYAYHNMKQIRVAQEESKTFFHESVTVERAARRR